MKIIVTPPPTRPWHACLYVVELVDTSVLEEMEENKKMFKIIMFGSQESRVNRSQGLKKEKEGTFKNLGLVAAQCNDIAACVYSLKIFRVHTLLYLTVHGL